MRVKILYVIDNLEFGGGGRVLSQLAGALKDRYEILFACQPGGLLEERLRALGIPVRPLNFRHRLSLPRILRLAAIIRREGVHVVHSMGARADFSARIAARLAGAPVIVSTVAMLAEGYEVSPVRRVLYRAAVRWSERLSSGFIAVSEAVRQTLVEDHRIRRRRELFSRDARDVDRGIAVVPGAGDLYSSGDRPRRRRQSQRQYQVNRDLHVPQK